MTALFLVGDIRQRQAELIAADEQFDLIITSPPFLALRSYLPDDHPDKDKEIGSEATPADYLDILLELTAQWRQLLAPHGSIAIELGDTYAGGGQGADAKHPGSVRPVAASHGPGWPLDKSLTGIPDAYALSLEYGYNVLRRNGPDSPAGMWRVRNKKPWIRTNPPVGALSDKDRPATSYITVATLDPRRYFDLDAVRSPHAPHGGNTNTGSHKAGTNGYSGFGRDVSERAENPAGAPPLDWWHQIDAIIDNELRERTRDAGKPNSHSGKKWTGTEHPGTGWNEGLPAHADTLSGARGHHIRKALERAGILTTLDALDISPKGYAGAHYAVWPKELVQQLVDEMCPRRVCTQCGEPSRRIVGETTYHRNDSDRIPARLAKTDGQRIAEGVNQHHQANGANTSVTAQRPTLGWSDCGHDDWRPGRILDPFVGSGTTLAVATGMARDAIGIDLDYVNAGLAMDRVGMLLDVDWPPADLTITALPRGNPTSGAYAAWLTDQQARQLFDALVAAWHTGPKPPPTAIHRHNGQPVIQVTGQLGMLLEPPSEPPPSIRPVVSAEPAEKSREITREPTTELPPPEIVAAVNEELL